MTLPTLLATHPAVKYLLSADPGKNMCSQAPDPVLAPTSGLGPPLLADTLETHTMASISEILGSLRELKGGKCPHLQNFP